MSNLKEIREALESILHDLRPRAEDVVSTVINRLSALEEQPKPTPVLTVEQVDRLRSFVIASPATSASMSKKRREILEWINMLTTTP